MENEQKYKNNNDDARDRNIDSHIRIKTTIATLLIDNFFFS